MKSIYSQKKNDEKHRADKNPPTPAPQEEKENKTAKQERKGQIAFNYRLECYAFQK